MRSTEDSPLISSNVHQYSNEDYSIDLNNNNNNTKVHNNAVYSFLSNKLNINITKEKEWFFSRWQSLAGVCLFVSISGSTYAFGVYSQLLKTDLGFTQTNLDVVASIGNTGLYLSLVGGLLLEKFGLQFVVMFGGLLIFIGFLYIYLAVNLIVPADVASIGFFYFLSQFGVCCHVSSAVTTCIRLFPYESRGSAVGLGKGYFALSSAVLGDFSGGYFYYSPKSFLLFVAIFTPIVDGYIEYQYDLSTYVSSLFATILGITILSIVYIPHLYGSIYITVDATNKQLSLYKESQSIYPNIPKKEDIQKKRLTRDVDVNVSNKYTDFNGLLDKNNVIEDSEDDDSFRLTNGSSNITTSNQSNSLPHNSSYHDCYYGKSMSLTKVIKTWRFWALYFIYMTVTGTGLMVIYNINAITESFSVYPSSFFVALISLANGLGRVLTGLSSDYLMKHLSKLQLMSFICMLMSLTQFGFLLVPILPGLLYVSLLLTGFLFGSIVAIIAVNIADIFGSKYIATNFGAIDSAPIFGSYIYATFLVSIFYQPNVFDDEGTSTCVGYSCFHYTFLISCIACLLAGTSCYILHMHTFIPYREGSSKH